jgi:hypothetical protein
MEALGISKGALIVADSAEPKSIEELRRLRWTIDGVKKGADSIMFGINLLKGYSINVHSSSKNLIKELEQYKWKVDRNGDSLNVPIDGYNHAIDALRYLIMHKFSVRKDMEHTKLSKMTVGQYQLLNEIDGELPVMEQNIYAVAAIQDITYEEASKVKLKDFAIMIAELGEFNIKQLEKLKINSRIILNGSVYHVEHKPEKLTSGQLLDIINIRSKYQGEGVKVMDLLLAAISKPEGKNYGDDKLSLNERAALN